jgi:hypothetical protein
LNGLRNAAGSGDDLKLHLGDVELKRKDAKFAKGIIVEYKRFLRAFASLPFKTLQAEFTARAPGWASSCTLALRES